MLKWPSMTESNRSELERMLENIPTHLRETSFRGESKTTSRGLWKNTNGNERSFGQVTIFKWFVST